MRIAGRRSDGALHLALGGGLSVVLLGEKASPPSDEVATTKLGPWYQADDSLGARTAHAKRLDRARVVTLFSLSMSFDEQRERVCCALRKMLGLPTGYGGGPYPVGMDLWIPTNGMGDDWVVYCIGSPGRNYAIGYTITPTGDVSFTGTPDEVVQAWESVLERAAEEQGVEVETENITEMAAEKKKQPWWMKAKKIAATDMPGSLPNLSGGSTTGNSVGAPLKSNY